MRIYNMNDSDAENKLSRRTNTNTLHPGNLQKKNPKELFLDECIDSLCTALHWETAGDRVGWIGKTAYLLSHSLTSQNTT